MERGDLSYSELLQKIVELLSSAMQYPEAISVLLKIEDQEFKTRKFTSLSGKYILKLRFVRLK
jgi:hypothetical protein